MFVCVCVHVHVFVGTCVCLDKNEACSRGYISQISGLSVEMVVIERKCL